MSEKIFRYLCLVLGLAGLACTAWFYASFVAERSMREASDLRNSQKDALRVAVQINNDVNQIVDTSRRMAKDLSGGNLTRAGVEQRLMMEARRIPEMQAIGIAYAPDEKEPGNGLFARYYVRDDQGIFRMDSFDYDYTNPPKGQDNWYERVSKLQGTWSEPVKDVSNNNLQVVYALPFTRWDRIQLKEVPAGVVFAALALDDFRELVKELDLGDEGYAYIVSGKGNYLVHPDGGLINTSMAEYASRIADPDLQNDVIKAVEKGELYDREGMVENRPAWYFYEPIPAAGWSVGIALQKDPRNEMVQLQKTRRVQIGLLLTLSLTLIAIFAFKLHVESQRSMWAVSVAASVFMAGVIVLIWVLEIASPATLNFSNVLSSHAILTKKLESVDQAFLREELSLPARIPTGMYIESFAVDGRDITFTGYIWQKYPAALIDEENPPTVVFLDCQSQEQELAYQFTERDTVVVGHYFRVSQVQTFASDKYPLDLEMVSLQLQASSLDKNYLFVPDLDSYNATNPSSILGIKQGLRLNNWNLVGSAFTYYEEPRDMDFGSKQIKQYNLPTLQFDISLKRFIFPSLLSYGITAIVTAIMIFSLVVSQAENLRSVLTESFALFFVLVVAHVGLRSELAAQGIVYLETLFIMLYGLILFGVLNGLLQFVNVKIPLISYKDGLLFKLLYWPILFGGFLIVSLARFYPDIFR